MLNARSLVRIVLRLILAGCATSAASGASANDYAFQVSASVDPSYVTRTFAQDQAAEFETASKLVSIYIRAFGFGEAKIVRNSYVYIVYHDGKIGKFKIIGVRDSIKVRFDTLVPAVPGGVIKNSQFDIPVSEYLQLSDIYVAVNYALLQQSRVLRPSVTVIPLGQTVMNFGGGCGRVGGDCVNPILLRGYEH